MEQDALTDGDLRTRRHLASLWLVTVLCGIGLAAFMLYVFPPGESGFYPACPFREWTGWLCPGCGGTRAVAALLHGRFSEAMQWNGVVVIAVAVCAGWAAAGYRRAMMGLDRVWMRAPRALVYGGVGASLIFSVVRNLV